LRLNVKPRIALFIFLSLAIGAPSADSQSLQKNIGYTGPIIDVHLHTDPPASAIGVPNPVTGTPAAASALKLRDATLKELEKYHVVRAVLNGWPGTLDDWVSAIPNRFLVAPMILKDNANPVLSADSLRQQLKSGKAALIGEITGQYVGLQPENAVLEPFWRLAEELDVPVMIHMGTSFPGTAYSGYPAFRLSLGNPILLEEVLVKHPKLRLWMAHGGEPWTQETFALMQQYPQLYMDISTIAWIGGAEGRAGFHSFLRQAITLGLGARIMFGTDQMAWPDAIGLAIKGVDSAEFLTPQQKRAIFYENAVRFLRLKEPLN
jgi:hypothetical protein